MSRSAGFYSQGLSLLSSVGTFPSSLACRVEMCSQKFMPAWGIFHAVNISVGSVGIPGCPQARDEGKACMLILTGDLCWRRRGDEEGTCPGWGFVPPVARAGLTV